MVWELVGLRVSAFKGCTARELEPRVGPYSFFRV